MRRVSARSLDGSVDVVVARDHEQPLKRDVERHARLLQERERARIVGRLPPVAQVAGEHDRSTGVRIVVALGTGGGGAPQALACALAYRAAHIVPLALAGLPALLATWARRACLDAPAP